MYPQSSVIPHSYQQPGSGVRLHVQILVFFHCYLYKFNLTCPLAKRKPTEPWPFTHIWIRPSLAPCSVLFALQLFKHCIQHPLRTLQLVSATTSLRSSGFPPPSSRSSQGERRTGGWTLGPDSQFHTGLWGKPTFPRLAAGGALFPPSLFLLGLKLAPSWLGAWPEVLRRGQGPTHLLTSKG